MLTPNLHLGLLSDLQKFEQMMANLIFDSTDLNYGKKSMKIQLDLYRSKTRFMID